MWDFRRLEVWKTSHQLALDVYRTSAAFPRDEVFGLRSQLRRAAVSVPTNIVEGTSRRSDGDARRFLRIALGSASEMEYLILISHDLGLLTESQRDDLVARVQAVRRMLNAFINRLQSAEHDGRRRPGPARRP